MLSFHGPDRAFTVVEQYGPPRLGKWRVRHVQPLTFNWVQDTSGEWSQDFSMYVPLAAPVRVPDYSREETSRIIVAEMRRAERAGIAVPLHVGYDTLPPTYFTPGTYEVNGVVTGSPWAVAYWRGWAFRFERAGLGCEWSKKSLTWGMG